MTRIDMAFHSTPVTNKQLRHLLLEAGIDPKEGFIMATIIGKPARTKGKVVIKGKSVTVFGSDFVCKGYLK